MVVDHHGLFIYLDLKYPKPFHDVSILRQSNIHMNWHRHFVHIDEYFEYMLGNPWYMGEDMFVMQCIGSRKLALGANLATILVYNKMHACIF
jgi:hypothetical protein